MQERLLQHAYKPRRLKPVNGRGNMLLEGASARRVNTAGAGVGSRRGTIHGAWDCSKSGTEQGKRQEKEERREDAGRHRRRTSI